MASRMCQLSDLSGTNLQIPRATIGTMMFGSRADAQEAQKIVDIAMDRGINFFDTANMYNAGESERLLGRALKGRREQAIVATKVGYGKNDDGNEEGTSRKAIMRAIDLSLKGLDTDYVDIYYLHRPDYSAPIEETLTALAEVIEAGKVRHFGLSNFATWQSYEVCRICDQNGWPQPVMSQMIYNMLLRQIEYEYIAFCKAQNLHLTVYNPLAGGLLTGKYRCLTDERKGGRFVGNAVYRKRYWSQRMLDGAHGLQKIADGIGMPLTHMAINWITQRDAADSVLLGPSNADQFLDCLAADETDIPPEAMKRINQFLADFDGTNATYAR